MSDIRSEEFEQYKRTWRVGYVRPGEEGKTIEIIVIFKYARIIIESKREIYGYIPAVDHYTVVRRPFLNYCIHYYCIILE